MNKTMQHYYTKVNEATRVKSMPSILACAAEVPNVANLLSCWRLTHIALPFHPLITVLQCLAVSTPRFRSSQQIKKICKSCSTPLNWRNSKHVYAHACLHKQFFACRVLLSSIVVVFIDINAR